ncbi:hypothetical protein [Caldivirga sp.]|uniref:hypothetical protein n=1 Tax=Caldivirga sp. TaxID=2080243 RepID=UPI003D0C5960
MTFALRVRPIVLKPSTVFLGERPSDVGYWGFVRSGSDYEGELAAIVKDLSGIVGDLSKEGYSISLQPVLEVSSIDDFMNHAGELRDAHLAVLLPIAPVALYQYPERSVLVSLLSVVDYVVVFDRFSEHIYLEHYSHHHYISICHLNPLN